MEKVTEKRVISREHFPEEGKATICPVEGTRSNIRACEVIPTARGGNTTVERVITIPREVIPQWLEMITTTRGHDITEEGGDNHNKGRCYHRGRKEVITTTRGGDTIVMK